MECFAISVMGPKCWDLSKICKTRLRFCDSRTSSGHRIQPGRFCTKCRNVFLLKTNFLKSTCYHRQSRKAWSGSLWQQSPLLSIGLCSCNLRVAWTFNVFFRNYPLWVWHTVHLQVSWTFNTVSPSSASRQTIWYLIAPCYNLAVRLLLQVNRGCARTRPAVSCGAKEEAHFEGELRLGGGDQGGHRGGHWDGQVANVGSLDVTRYTWVYLDMDILALPVCTGTAARTICSSGHRRVRSQSAGCKPTWW